MDGHIHCPTWAERQLCIITHNCISINGNYTNLVLLPLTPYKNKFNKLYPFEDGEIQCFKSPSKCIKKRKFQATHTTLVRRMMWAEILPPFYVFILIFLKLMKMKYDETYRFENSDNFYLDIPDYLFEIFCEI